MDQSKAAESLLAEMECCGDVGEVSVFMILDSLACAGLKLEEATQAEASEAYLSEVASIEV